jgi:hypothetical protein
MSLGMFCAFGNIHNMEGGYKMCPSITQLFLENMKRAKGKLMVKIEVVLLYKMHLQF